MRPLNIKITKIIVIVIIIFFFNQILINEIVGEKNSSTLSKAKWMIEEIDFFDYKYNSINSLVIDSKDNPNLLCFNNNEFCYAKWTGNKWIIKTIDIKNDLSTYEFLALDSNDNPHISYFEDNNKRLKYARWNGESWEDEIVDLKDYLVSISSLVLDPNGNPHICYYNRSAARYGNLKYATKIENKWITETIDSGDNVGDNPYIILDTNLKPIIYYYDYNNNCLKMARYNGIDWVIQRFESINGLSREDTYVSAFIYYSLSIDASFNPHICYKNKSNNTLNYAKWTGKHWNIITLDTFEWSFQDCNYALTLDSNGNPHVCYNDPINFVLKYIKWEGNNWSIDIIDSDHDYYNAKLFSLDSLGNPHIIYYFQEYIHYEGLSGHQIEDGYKYAKLKRIINEETDENVFIPNFEAIYLIITMGIIIINYNT